MRNPNYLTLRDAADAVDKSTASIRRYIREGSGLVVTRIGKTPYIHRDDFEAWLRSKRQGA